MSILALDKVSYQYEGAKKNVLKKQGVVVLLNIYIFLMVLIRHQFERIFQI